MGPVEMVVTNNNLPLLSLLEKTMRDSLLKTMGEIGALLEATAVKAIKDQTAPGKETWPQLSEWYQKWKQKKGYSEQIYIMTSSYVQAITWKVKETQEDFQTIVGVMRDSGTVLRGEEELWRVAEILEYGWEEFNVHIPPRPLWRPNLEVNKRKIQTRIGASIYWSTEKIRKMAKGEVL